MIGWLLDRVFPGRLSARLEPRKRVRLHGIVFTIRKLNPLDYLTGAKALHKVYDIYQGRAPGSITALDEANVEAVKRHYRDTLLQGVVSVRLMGAELEPTLKDVQPGEKKIPVANLMTDWDLAEELYTAIVVFTYGKKKLRTLMRLHAKNSSK